MNAERHPPVLGVIYGNRDFFPDHLVAEARTDVSAVFDRLGIRTIQLEPTETKLGGVETLADARKCAELFRQHRNEIDGVLVCLPNFGDEKAVLETLRRAGLNVPVLVQAYPDDLQQLDVGHRRDAWCGKISVCNNLVQAGIKFTLTTKHVLHPATDLFERDLKKFIAVCRVVNGLRGARLGAIGARPGAFNTVRYSEKILERCGISVTTVDLSEILAKADKLDPATPEVQAKLAEIKSYAVTNGVPIEKLRLLAKLAVVVEQWMQANALDATAVQCWTSVQTNYGCNFCTIMSMFSQRFMPSACEVDLTGTLTMYAMQLAAEAPAALVDWNNNYGEQDDKCVLFHCGNWARSFLPDATLSTAPILGTVVGEQNTWGALAGRTPAGPVTFGRITTADTDGCIRAYVAEGWLTNDPLDTFGARAVAHVPGLQKLMQYICKRGFEHHVAITVSHTADVLAEALGNYMGWDVYRHQPVPAALEA